MPRALPAALLLPGAMPKRRAAEEGSPPPTPAAAAPRKRGAARKAAREAPAATQEDVASGVAAAEEEQRAFAERGDGARVRIATSGFTLPQKRYWALFNCLEARTRARARASKAAFAANAATEKAHRTMGQRR
jgi:hypothetical protein